MFNPDIDQLTSHPLVEKVLRLFGKERCRTQVAALPWRIAKKKVEIMLITSRDTGRWVIPKGWRETGEESHEGAAREAVEEAGLTGSIGKREAGRYFYDKGIPDGRDIPCEVLVFPLEVDAVASKWKERGQRKRKWVAAEKAASMVAEPELQAIILAFAAKPRKFG